jgi:chemotaxis protein CheX
MAKTLKAAYINPFVTKSVDTLRQFLPDADIERGDISAEETPFKADGTVTYLGISGDLEGRVIFQMEIDTALKIAGAMNQEEFDELNDIARSTIQELGNIISGNATTQLRSTADGKTIDITPPCLMIGQETTISDSVRSNYLKVPLHTTYGDFIINLAVQEA